ncbi:MAG: DUF4143 domain-containing protein [Candidatus Methanoplasma sp.]|jgi:predicted AAA+ superfamily ATPase|nr:DUF4143 domain-containing protein [Candidatus Methanoplasma sp.]
MGENADLPAEDIRDAYKPRLIDNKVKRLLSIHGGVLITGPKWCGKSWTGMMHSKSAISMANDVSRRLAQLDPQSALSGERPRLIDEWQELPGLWDSARLKIDASRKKGLFLFTGSYLPSDKATAHSGAGRFALLKMRTMSLFEYGYSNGAVSLSGLFDGKAFETTYSSLNYSKAVRLICRGGWPDAMQMSDEDSVEIPKAYLEILYDHDSSRVDGRKRSPEKMKKIVMSIARNTATCATLRSIASDMAGKGGRGPSENTVADYLGALKRLFLLEEQSGWSPNLRSATRMRSSPKRHLTDPSLAAAAICNGPGELERDPNTAGLLFESLCYRDLCIYVADLGGEVCYYSDNSGLEVDFVIQLKDGRWGAIEAKMGTSEFEKATRNLNRLRDKMVSGGLREPSFLMILNVTGQIAIRREDGIIEAPIDCLGP